MTENECARFLSLQLITLWGKGAQLQNQENKMQTAISIQSLLQGKTIEKLNKTSERSENMKELYSLYCSPSQQLMRKKENWARYISWLKENRVKHTHESVKKFRKIKKGQNKFIEQVGLPSFCFLTSHIKTSDFYYVLSVARDKQHRGESIGAWLLAKPK